MSIAKPTGIRNLPQRPAVLQVGTREALERPETKRVMVNYQAPTLRSKRNDPAYLFDTAVSAHERGMFADAERLYAKVLKRNESPFEPVCRLGIVYLQH